MHLLTEEAMSAGASGGRNGGRRPGMRSACTDATASSGCRVLGRLTVCAGVLSVRTLGASAICRGIPTGARPQCPWSNMSMEMYPRV
jgi:hypothetical protein